MHVASPTHSRRRARQRRGWASSNSPHRSSLMSTSGSSGRQDRSVVAVRNLGRRLAREAGSRGCSGPRAVPLLGGSDRPEQRRGAGVVRSGQRHARWPHVPRCPCCSNALLDGTLLHMRRVAATEGSRDSWTHLAHQTRPEPYRRAHIEAVLWAAGRSFGPPGIPVDRLARRCDTGDSYARQISARARFTPIPPARRRTSGGYPCGT